MDEQLTEHEIEVIGEALVAWGNGPFIEDWEFSIVCSCERSEMNDIARLWPGNQEEKATKYAVNDALNNLLGYPHDKMDEVERRLLVSESELERIYSTWRRLNFDSKSGKFIISSDGEDE